MLVCKSIQRYFTLIELNPSSGALAYRLIILIWIIAIIIIIILIWFLIWFFYKHS
jgi:hypothetical protein